ncbi:MAG TPA: helix-hairpin-helix domain-containing protein, partial [Bdellovibrionota bacterium]|nr:helix-hairpin-helix domain-containing protein [Bdellovibrionota bacterium]
EVLERRFRPDPDRIPLPDLVIIDGGKGQLNVATQVLKQFEVEGVDLVGLAKGRTEAAFQEKEIKKTEERIFLPGRKNPLILRSGPGLHLLERIRDETHRFGISHHRKARGKAELHSVLDGIPGIGPKKKRALLRYFGSVESIRRATVEEITAVKGMTPTLAKTIHKQLTGE